MLVGFDGFIDTTVGPILKTATGESEPIYFETIKEFGEFLVSKSDKSCSIELKIEEKIAGGNMPFLTKKNTGILSLNENEALIISERIFENCADLAEIAENLRKKYQIDEIIVHMTKKNLIASSRGINERETLFVENPKKTTGAGDTFNGSFCFATLLG